jgi:hypothetical protein
MKPAIAFAKWRQQRCGVKTLALPEMPSSLTELPCDGWKASLYKPG